MKRSTALKLLRRYTDDFYNKLDTDDPVIIELADRFPEDGSKDKAMRWLGFAQGIAYAWGFGLYSLNELKEHSREAVRGEEAEETEEA